MRSLKVPGSPSSPLTAISRGPFSARTRPHLRPVGKPAPPKPAQAAVGQRRDHVVHLARARQARAQHGIAAGLHVGVEVLVGGHRAGASRRVRPARDLGDAGMIDMMVADLGGRRGVARADARRAHHAHARHLLALQGRQQLLGAGQHAAQAVADAHRHRRRPRLAVGHDVEVGVEGRDLVDLRHRDLELFGQRLQMPLRQAALLVLDQVQILDQQRALARPSPSSALTAATSSACSTRPWGKAAPCAGPSLDGSRGPNRACRRPTIAMRRSFSPAGDCHCVQRPKVWHTIYQCSRGCRGCSSKLGPEVARTNRASGLSRIMVSERWQPSSAQEFADGEMR